MKTNRHHPQYELIYAETRYSNDTDFTVLILAKYSPEKGRWFNVARHAIFSNPEEGPADGLAELTRSLDHWLSYDDGGFCWAVESYFSAIARDFDEDDMLGYPDAEQYEDFQVVRSVRAEFNGTDDVRFVDQIAEAEGKEV